MPPLPSSFVAELVLADFLDRERDAVLDRLVEWLRIPAISADPAHAGDVRASAEWCAARMRAVGLEHVELLETEGHPSVYGDWLHAPGAPTVVVYGHHDVQPVDPLDAWVSPPFEGAVRDGQLFARGAVDDKGQVAYHLEAIGALLARDGSLPVNLKVLVEGEEEIGSPNFEDLLVRERSRLAADVVIVSDTSMWSAEVPSMCTGMRGLVTLEVTLRTAEVDLHSGSFGGAVPNPAHHLVRILAALHDANGRVAVPGFYDAVRAMTDGEQASFAALPFDEGEFRATATVDRLEGEAGFTTLERLWVRPTAEITGMSSGFTGEGVKTIVPSSAHAKLALRLVPDQDPVDEARRVEAWIRAQVPDGIAVEVRRESDGVRAALTPLDHPAVAAASRAIERVWGRAPLFTREGGSGPEESLGRVLDAPVVFLGVGLPDDRIHAPNERVVLDQLWKGLLAVGELWFELGAAEAVDVRRDG
jgi:acetylornithine deacetylase/succinyl-diaminopimelate desuccinylase-like protein